jgi:hypothetical protein
LEHSVTFEPEALLKACEWVVGASDWVSLDEEGVASVARAVAGAEVPAWDQQGMFQGSDAHVVAWLLAYNAVNFCYWPEADSARWHTVVGGQRVGHDDEALGVMAAFGEAMRRDVPLWDGSFLAGLDRRTLEGLLTPAPGAGHLPMMDERLRGLQELGTAYLQVGGPLGLLKASAVDTVGSLGQHCPGWRDTRVLGHTRLDFMKRAQLCVAMIHGRLGGRGVGAFPDLHRLTVFADYRLPQILRGMRVLRVHPELAARIDGEVSLPAGSAEEVSLRAAAVHAAHRLCQVSGAGALEVDYWLWKNAVEHNADLPTFHRTRCTEY